MSTQHRAELYGLFNSFKFTPRYDRIRWLEGWYQHTPKGMLEDEWKASGTRLSYSRWLFKNKGWTSDAVSREIKRTAAYSIKFTTKYNDLLRMSDTPHFISCLHHMGMCCFDMRKVLTDPRVGMFYRPDKSGKIMGRVVVVFTSVAEADLLIPYGDISTESCVSVLRDKGYVVNLPYLDVSTYRFAPRFT